jgi:DNA-binding response OmpR family regulator
VDDEPDVLDSIAEQLDMCRIYRAKDYEIALQLMAGFKFDIVVLDVMGVRGFELLKKSVSKGFPTVMLTAHAMTPESLKESIKLGAVSFLPKEMMADLDTYLTDVITGSKKMVWKNLLDKLGDYFDRQFGPDWKERDEFFKKFEEELKSAKENQG